MLDTRMRFAYFPMMHLTSKLPDLGVTIFAVMTQLANKHGAINLSQGFPDFDTHPVYIQLKYPKYNVDWDEVRQVVSNKTRLIILNYPHNPTGAVLSERDRFLDLLRESRFYALPCKGTYYQKTKPW